MSPVADLLIVCSISVAVHSQSSLSDLETLMMFINGTDPAIIAIHII